MAVRMARRRNQKPLDAARLAAGPQELPPARAAALPPGEEAEKPE